MKFNTQAEAFSYYKDMPEGIVEARAEAIRNDIASNPECDIDGYNIELAGLKAVKDARKVSPAIEQRGELYQFAHGQIVERAEKSDDVLSTTEYRSAFFKQLMGRELSGVEREAMQAARVEFRNDAYNTSSNSAAVLPTSTLNEVIVKARKMGGIIEACRGFNMPTGIAIPVATPTAKAAWHVEGASVDREAVSPASVTFDGYEIIKLLSISAKVETMSIPAFESYLTDELSQSVVATIADSLVNGTGSAQGTGLISGITWATTGDGKNEVEVAADASLTYADIIAAIAMLKRGYAQGAQFAMNNATLYNSVYGLVDENKRPIFVADPVEAGKGRILGFPVIVDDYLADDDIVFGNFKYMGYNMPSGIVLERSRESGFRNGLIDFRALAIADTKPIVDEAFVRITKATE